MTGLSVFIITTASFFGLFWPAIFVLCWRDARATSRKLEENPPPGNLPQAALGNEIPLPERRRGIGFWMSYVPATATYILFCLVVAVFFWPCFLAGKRGPTTTTRDAHV